MPCAFWSPHSSSAEHPGASKPPISSSSMTSRILLRQQLMREQMQEQERREQQQKLQAAQFLQQRVPASQTPAINVSAPTTLPSATQVPMEVLKVRARHACGGTQTSSFFRFLDFLFLRFYPIIKVVLVSVTSVGSDMPLSFKRRVTLTGTLHRQHCSRSPR